MISSGGGLKGISFGSLSSRFVATPTISNHLHYRRRRCRCLAAVCRIRSCPREKGRSSVIIHWIYSDEIWHFVISLDLSCRLSRRCICLPATSSARRCMPACDLISLFHLFHRLILYACDHANRLLLEAGSVLSWHGSSIIHVEHMHEP